MKKTLLTIAVTFLSVYLLILLYANNFFIGLTPRTSLILSCVLGAILGIVSTLVIIDLFTMKEIFFFLVKKNYLKTTVAIRKERLTNVVYNGGEGGHGGSRQKEYKIEYRD